MILERLIDFHARVEDDIVPASFKSQAVRCILRIGLDGRFLGFIDYGKSRKNHVEFQIPYARRSSNMLPFLFADKADYVLRIPEAATQAAREKARERHFAHMRLVCQLKSEAALPEIDAYVRFHERHLAEAQSEAAERDIGASDWIMPQIEGTYLTSLKPAKQFWQLRSDAAEAEKSKVVGECLITGDFGPVARTHPVGLRIGPSPAPLVTTNEPAFRSYGQMQSEVAPMSFEAARKYGEALRFLLDSPQHSLWFAGVTWVFWTREKTDFPFATLFKEAELEDVRKLLKSAEADRERKALEANDFYALSLTENKRMVVRSWITTSLAEVQGNLATYFQRQRLVGRDGPRYHKLYALAGSLVRDFKDLPPQVVPALLENALLGRPLPLSILHKAVLRARAEREYVMPHRRAALIKLIILSHPQLQEAFAVTDQLNPENPHPAYQCGRLLALLDNIQSEAIGARATLVDRYYGSASATPASVFGVLLRNVQNHISKLKKSQSKDWLGRYFERRIGEIAQHFDANDGFPRTLSLEEQGLFALGFYQEKNRPRKEKEGGTGTSEADVNAEAPSPTSDLSGATA